MPTRWSRTSRSTSRASDLVVSRHARDAKAPGMNALMWPDAPEKVDKFTRMRWMPPCNLRLMTGICKPGADPQTGTGYHAIHMLTPESDRTTHYFFTAVRFNVMTTDDALNREIQDKIAKMRRFAFEEQDAPVIEAQQQAIDNAIEPGRSADAGDRRRPGALQADPAENDRRRAGGITVSLSTVIPGRAVPE